MQEDKKYKRYFLEFYVKSFSYGLELDTDRVLFYFSYHRFENNFHENFSLGCKNQYDKSFKIIQYAIGPSSF